MSLTDINTSELAIASMQVVMYALIASALAYIYNTKRKGFFLFIVSFILFAVTRSVYILALITGISSVYYLTSYYFALALLAIGALLYNQKINFLFLGLLATAFFSIGINFLPEAIMRPVIYSYSIILHLIIIISFFKRKDKNVGDVLIILGLGGTLFWLIHKIFYPDLFESQLVLNKLIDEFIKAIGGLGLTIGLLLRIIFEHKHDLRLLTLKDDLSALANRRSLNNYVDELILRKSPFQLALIRIRGIRQLNETYGHQAGDEALRKISNKLKAYLVNKDSDRAEQGYLARLNGNYLVFIHYKPSKFASIEAIFLNCIEQCGVRNTRLQVGIASYPAHGSHFVEVLTAAELTLSECAEDNISYVHQIGAEKLQTHRQKQYMAKALAQVIANEEIDVYYQPKYTLGKNNGFNHIAKPLLLSAEALARWSYQGKPVSPVIFIQLAEEYGFIADLDALIMKKAWMQASELAKLGYHIKISVNYSSISMIVKDKLLGLVRNLIDTYDLSPALLEIEITESAMAKSGNTTEQLQTLRELGVSIAIDDFGTGYSNLSQLQALPLDTIKIDKSFVDLIGTNPMIIEFIIEMAHKLKLNIVAEGVEQQSQLNWLTIRGCQQIQGYLLSKPLTEECFVSLVTKS